MRSPQIRARGRQAFTLTELLLVIAIIAVLASLISAAVMRARTRMREVACRTEIAQLEDALQTFHTKFNFYPPSRMIICERYDQYFAGPATNPQFISPLHQLSAQTLERMFPRAVDQWRATGIDWNGDGTLTPPVALEGHQCLVFFLGGVPTASDPPACQGFASGPDPTAATMTDRIKPYFEFQADRLRRNPTNRFLVYLDTHNLAPYAFFSAGKSHNGYVLTDCAGISSSFSGQVPCNVPKPYRVNATEFWRADNWQIISAGADGKFGTSLTTWGAASLYKKGDPGFDDQANFTANLLSTRP